MFKNQYKYIFRLIVLTALLASGYKTFAHSVQVAYCANCNGDLRIWVEHWHTNEDINSTTMTLEVTVNGVTTSQTGSPNLGVLDVVFGNLPGCSTPLTLFGSCPGQANTHNDWVAYDFTGMPVGVPIVIKIISGNNAFTQDGCTMYPASTGVIIIEPPAAVSNVTSCGGTNDSIGPFDFAQGNNWTNDNTAIGLGASGTGDIPAFIPNYTSTTQVANITISNTCGTSSFSITVKPSPKPNFTGPGIIGDPGVACPGKPITFADLSTPATGTSLASWTWDFGDGSPPVTGQNPTHTFPINTNIYVVTLTAVDSNGCSPDTSIIVDISGPSAEFAASSVCDNTAAVFTDASTPANTITSWNWDINNDGSTEATTQNTNFLFSSPGTYEVKLLIESLGGCKDSVVHPLVVHPNPVADFSFSNVCLNTPMSFTDLSSSAVGNITGWSWSFDDGSPANTGSNPSHTFTSPGTYSVTLTVTSDTGCSGTISKSVKVYPLPVADFSTLNVCITAPAAFNDLSTVPLPDTLQSWAWNFGDSSPLSTTRNSSHQYSDSGTYTIGLLVTSAFGCVDSTTQSIVVYPQPVANYTNTSVCGGNATQFTDASTTPSGALSTWSWDFGDGSPLVGTQNTSHIYSVAGVKNATLTVNNSFGCADTISKQVTVYFNPVAGFTYNNVCSGDTMYFTNTTTVDTSASVLNYLWAFGDSGPNSFQQHPAHYYTNPGNYTVTLVITTTDGCSSAAIMPVNAFDAPTSIFTFSNICLSDVAVFTNTSAPPTTGTLASWLWNFGDGSSLNASEISPNHQYTSPGDYIVSLITNSSNLGCADTLTDTITIYNMPVANFGYVEVCEDQTMSFTDSSSISGGSALTGWSWGFSDGSPLGTAQNPTHTFISSGTHPVTLVVTTNYSCKDTLTKNAIVHPMPDVQLSAPNTCLGYITPFTDISTIASNPTNDIIQVRAWNYGDGSPVYNNPNSFHMYSDTGTYTIKLVVISTFGCSDSVTTTTTISPNPVVQFTSSDTIGCEPLCINFTDASTISGGNIQSYVWNFGDNTPEDTAQNPAHCFINDLPVQPIDYDVTLTVTSDSGCVTILSKADLITVQPKPEANFSALPEEVSIVAPQVTITDVSVGANYWSWNFGDGSTHFDTVAVTDSLIHTYADTGTYTVTLITTSQYGCMDTASQNAVVTPEFTFYVPSGFTPNNDGKNDMFCPVGLFITKYEMTIYDRWGNFVFYTDDINKCWDGSVNYGSQTTLQDVYVYVIKVRDNKKNIHYLRDTVTVIR